MKLSDYEPDLDAELDPDAEPYAEAENGVVGAETVAAPPPVAPAILPAPLQGCLYCHAEGTVSLVEGRKILGFGSGLPSLTCRRCGSVALFEAEPGSDRWRIRYKKVNRAPQYYYVMVFLGSAGWLEADEALEISRNGYVQRRRVEQATHGDLSWLSPAPLNPPPPLMSPDENVYLTIDPVAFQQVQAGATPSFRGQSDGSVLDSGCFYLSDRKVHLLGHRRDWSHKLSDIHDVQHTDSHWRIYVGTTGQYYQGANHPSQIDAQLFIAVVRALISRR